MYGLWGEKRKFDFNIMRYIHSTELYANLIENVSEIQLLVIAGNTSTEHLNVLNMWMKSRENK